MKPGTTRILTVAKAPLDGVFANEPIYFGLASSAIVYVAVSLRTTPTDPQVMRNWRRRVAGQDNEELPVPVPAA